MKHALSPIAALAFTLSLSLGCEAQVFSYTPENFRAALNRSIQEDATDKTKPDGDTLRNCRKKSPDTIACSFGDVGFKTTVAAMKKLDMLNGRFDQKLTITFKTKDGKVSSIRLHGERGDPPNQLRFMSAALNIMQVFDPTVVSTDEKMKSVAGELGLMRGDDAPDIGKKRTLIVIYAAVECLAVPSAISTDLDCEWVPRS